MINYKENPFSFKAMSDLDLLSIENSAKMDALNKSVSGSDLTPNTLNNHIKDIDTHLQTEVNGAQNKLHELQNNADNCIKEINKDNISINVAIKVKENVHLNADQESKKIENLNNLYEQRNNDFNRFRTFHNRSFLPTRATKGGFIIFGILSLLFIIEASMNALFFKEIGGLLVAFTLSFSQAFINVISCFFFGSKIWTKMMHANTLQKKVFFGFLVALHAYAIIWLNLAMGMFRALNTNNIFDEDYEKKLRWALTPFSHLDQFSMDSALVSGVGLILAFLAYLDGYFSDDPYPGYGKIYRQVIRARNKLTDKISSINNNIKSAEIDFDKTVLQFHKTNTDQISTWSQSINEMEKIEVDYKALVDDLTDRLKIIYETYNRNFRSKNYTPIFYSEKDRDPKIVFKDAKEYFMSDNDRRSKKDEYQKQLNIDFEEIRNRETKDFNINTEKLKNIISTYPRSTIGEKN